MSDKEGSSGSPGSDGQTWSISAGETLQGVLESEGCPPILQQSLTGAMTWQDRNRRLVSRALVSPSIAPQWTATLLALGASVTISHDNEEQTVPFDALFERQVKGAALSLHVPTTGVRWGEAHVGRTPADEPIVAAMAGIEVKDGIVSRACIALIGAWPKPVGLATAAGHLVGGPLGADTIQLVSQAVEEEIAPNGDFRGSEGYRRAMAGVLTRRALQQCLKGGIG